MGILGGALFCLPHIVSSENLCAFDLNSGDYNRRETNIIEPLLCAKHHAGPGQTLCALGPYYSSFC